MASVSIRDLRNHGGDVVDRVERGETVTVTRSGRPVAELRPVPKAGLTAEELLARCRRLPGIDPVAFRRDVDAIVDTSLW
jgi:prevent-host-death family protein